MHFIIVGAGSIGCYVGGRLAAAGQRVAFVGRPRTMAPLAQGGLTVSDLEGFKAHLETSQLVLADSVALAWSKLQDSKEPTVVLLCVKGGATEAAAREIGAACPSDTVVVSLQNGVENVARITNAAPHLQAVAGMAPYNVVALQPNQVHRGTVGSLCLADSPVTRDMAAVLTASGLPTVLAPDMRAVQWGKLLLNLNNPVNALSDLPLREELTDRDYRHVLAALQTEALAVMARADIQPAKASAVAPSMLPHVLRLPNWLFTRVAARMLRMDAQARSSMWEDMQQGRTTEIEDLCGAVVRLAAQHHTTAPLSAAMCQMVAAHQKGQRITGQALRQTLGIA
ncbi:2-dehydropantoate 2-reductase [Rhodoferax saidenbachensis]|uniref:2-dehydropantoate 2-reductase n=1 Tax=Rhodoferax saidenbachensis TaxID=1484693 RepID=A0A1P8K855_9BURK|nr:2-dehydropantoate 2-reductase [Rhodoferax saidenbachensis]APW42169.1 2-dehydropantoate 2-reductase [Rhodoferax saidenbachensis]